MAASCCFERGQLLQVGDRFYLETLFQLYRHVRTSKGSVGIRVAQQMTIVSRWYPAEAH